MKVYAIASPEIVMDYVSHVHIPYRLTLMNRFAHAHTPYKFPAMASIVSLKEKLKVV